MYKQGWYLGKIYIQIEKERKIQPYKRSRWNFKRRSRASPQISKKALEKRAQRPQKTNEINLLHPGFWLRVFLYKKPRRKARFLMRWYVYICLPPTDKSVKEIKKLTRPKKGLDDIGRWKILKLLFLFFFWRKKENTWLVFFFWFN